MNRTQLRALVVSLAVLSAAAWAAACSEDANETPAIRDEAPSDPSADPSTETPERSAQPDEAAQRVRAQLSKMRVHLDLLALAHLADVDHHGLYMDFGTPARMHYTMGRWHSGFLRDVTAGERDFTRIGTDARAFFDVDRAGPITLRVRGRAIASQALVVYVNGQRAGQIDFDGGAVQEHDVAVPGSLVNAGENALMIRAAQTRAVEGEDVAAEIDSIWVMSATPPAAEPGGGALEPPRYAELVRELTVGGEARRAVVVRGPTRVRWYAEIPEGGQLSFALGASSASSSASSPARARITVTPESPDGHAEPTLVFDGPVTGTWTPRLADLHALVGEVVRIEMAIEGDGAEVGIAGPAVVVPLPAQALAPAQARSVVLLLVDTLRASKLRPYNPGSRVQAPTLDRFAQEAAVFDHAQAPENWTKPSVASILTSLTPMTHNTKEQSSSLPQSALMISEVFHDQHFATATFLANGYVSDRFGFDQGWDFYTNYIRDERPTDAGHVFRDALQWVEAHREERFFVYIQTIDPHVPYDPPDETLRLYDQSEYTGPLRNRSTGLQLEDIKNGRMVLTDRDREHLMALHDGEITYHDQEMARFVARLQELGLYDEIVFVVTSDHGEEFNEHGSYGHGHSIYQELLHVPLMMRWHGVIDPRRVGPTVSTMDIAPTLCEATGVPIPDEFEGHSLLSSARGVTRPGPAIAFSDKLDDRRVAMGAGYKLVVRGNLTWAFFDLRTDPNERDEISDGGRHPIALRYLRGLYGQHLGAADRGEWLLAGTGGASHVLPQAESQMDADMCRQLRALGYIDARCDDLL